MGAVLEITGLRKGYRSLLGSRQALAGADLSVGAGEVHGLLGPAGAGKTTVLRSVLGLVRADAGRMTLFGHEVPRHLPAVIGAVGAVVDGPVFNGRLSAIDTLALLADLGNLERKRVFDTIELVGLQGSAKEPVRTYSPAARQCLAVATALLKQPQLVILDDPAAGLDPAGLHGLAALLRRLAGAGVTVLLTSRQPAEVVPLCDTVTVLDAGRRVAAGRVAEVLAPQGVS